MCPGSNQHGLHALQEGWLYQSQVAFDDQTLKNSNPVWVGLLQVQSSDRQRRHPNEVCCHEGEGQGSRDFLAEARELLFR